MHFKIHLILWYVHVFAYTEFFIFFQDHQSSPRLKERSGSCLKISQLLLPYLFENFDFPGMIITQNLFFSWPSKGFASRDFVFHLNFIIFHNISDNFRSKLSTPPRFNIIFFGSVHTKMIISSVGNVTNFLFHNVIALQYTQRKYFIEF